MKKLLLTLLFVSFLNTNAQNPVQEFNFNGNLTSADNTISFLGVANFVNDRMGVAKGAQRLTNKTLQGMIGDLPQGNKPRSISIWVKFNAINAVNYILGYGTAVNTQYFGLVQQATAGGNSDVSLVGWGDTNNVIASVPLLKDVWYQYSITYDGNTSKVYRNGQLLKSVNEIPRLTKGYILRLGIINTTTGINADIDDLKIYNVAMTDEQVMESYNSSKPTTTGETENVQSSNTVKKVNPAITAKAKVAAKSPASGSANATETNSGSKTVEVFSQGRKIAGSNASNIGDLPEGTYLIKVTNNPAKK
ncbi:MULTISPECIES: LamG-like jellyroll fold domain-containing protein [unclassified Flavobacterium]|uniref:LamG-like jellyroll fold domain-containing protein n=1 Tax=unclassified Flavobacterium TaxID=196869 RepID=UPI0012A8CB50|nr:MULTISPECIES: LamG-like jellyroll fold domain-containing protein [unclassified Flavobacterium]MBF4484234.1 LamG domain-containing protein [Flavobacterium sp. CSZ]QGK74780.1 LamG domain-containing protein [Flavobacterium sp. SLB02]